MQGNPRLDCQRYSRIKLGPVFLGGSCGLGASSLHARESLAWIAVYGASPAPTSVARVATLMTACATWIGSSRSMQALGS